MNDLTITAIAGVLVSVISFLSYKLGQSHEENKNAVKESEAVEEAKRLRERLKWDEKLKKKLKDAYSRLQTRKRNIY